ncbi:MAG: 3-dehydroquinate synthase [Planctomycetaceae bacterium]|nr:3-dehydroquinate synthase [Planctomycetaceae bacterium]
MNVQTIQVNVPAVEKDAYPIAIGEGIIPEVLSDVRSKRPKLRAFVVTDAAVAGAGHLHTLLGGEKVGTFVIEPAGEASKHIGTVTAIVETMEKAGLGRDTVVLALGGGTVGDIAGFAAAIFKRGVPVVQIPTTTVAQADSAIGGKTGVDSLISKNAYGVFWHPAAVYIDVRTLTTLDERQYRAGLAESVKHAAILDAEYFEWLETHAETILKRDMQVLGRLASMNCTIKASVVEEDPTEKNKRRILNYGHTIGHAVESASGYELLHGECVAIGMAAAGQIETELGLVGDNRLERIESLLKGLGLPTRIPADLPSARLIDLLRTDKKAMAGRPRFVLLERLGMALCRDGQWAHEVSEDTVRKVVKQMLDKQ